MKISHKMRIYYFLPLFCIFLFIEEYSALKCRTGNQQTNEQFRKVMQICRRRNSNNGRSEDSSDENDSDESGSDEDLFDKRFLSGINRRNNSFKGNGSSNRGKFDMEKRRQIWRQKNFREDNMKNRQNNSNTDKYRHNWRNIDNNSQNNNHDDNNEDQHGPACIIQCFFNELNLVDQRGFPERNSVTGIMTENIQDPELRDFVEESITECYHFLRNDMNQDKCRFSQNLLSCLSEKSSQRCDDWNDD